MTTTRFALGAALAAFLALAPASAGTTSADEPGIQWFATWAQAKAEAARTQRPILLTSAAPHCRQVSGMW